MQGRDNVGLVDFVQAGFPLVPREELERLKLKVVCLPLSIVVIAVCVSVLSSKSRSPTSHCTRKAHGTASASINELCYCRHMVSMNRFCAQYRVYPDQRDQGNSKELGPSWGIWCTVTWWLILCVRRGESLELKCVSVACLCKLGMIC